jgi:hypothetical protein
MSLMKWFRKYNRRLIAIFVVGLMFVFIGGSALRMSCRYAGPRRSGTIALYGKKSKITLVDIDRANRELEILRQTGAQTLLRSRDIHGILLDELLFSENRISPELFSSLRQVIRTNDLRISDEQLLDMTKKTETPEIYWFLLDTEAQSAGTAVRKETAQNILRQIIPKLSGGATYSAVINGFIDRGISEEEVLSAYAKLFAVLEHASLVCTSEDLTRIQLSQLVSDNLQTMDVNFVKVRAELFTDDQAEPDENSISRQFDQYKTYFPGEITKENPYGFGYKLDNRVQLDYIIIKLDDVEKIIKKPTLDELQNYYSLHRSGFVEQVPIDPNDPNSLTMEQPIVFGRVKKYISNQLTNERVAQKVDEILGRAAKLAAEKYGDNEASELTAEQLRTLAVDYGDIADKLKQEYPLSVYSGRTGLLRFIDIQQDENLYSLLLRPAAPGLMPYALSSFVFSVGRPESPALELGNVQKPKVYETIGPFFSPMINTAALVRVVETKQAAVPESLDVTLSPAKIELDKSEITANNKSYSVRQKVVEDLKTLAAMQTAREKAKEFLSLAQEDGWDKAVEQYNRQHPPSEPDEPNNFELRSLTDLKRPSPDEDETISVQNSGLAGGHLAVNAHISDKMVLDTLFSLVPLEQTTAPQLPVSVEIRPDHSYYCIKDLTINRVDQSQYDKTKTLVARKYNTIEGQNLGIVYFKPENILERMNYRLIKKSKPQQAGEPNEPETEKAESPGES